MNLIPRNIFLCDGIGALLTATLLAAVIAPFETLFGMPPNVVYSLSAIAVVFAVYSLACHLTRPSNWPTLLRIIASANLLYCILTLILLFVYRGEITAFGFAYFIGEILVVLTLSIYELHTARYRSSDNETAPQFEG